MSGHVRVHLGPRVAAVIRAPHGAVSRDGDAVGCVPKRDAGDRLRAPADAFHVSPPSTDLMIVPCVPPANARD